MFHIFYNIRFDSRAAAGKMLAIEGEDKEEKEDD